MSINRSGLHYENNVYQEGSAVMWCKIGSSFIYVMYITATVGHLHDNGRLSERDKPKASSRELDAVFGIPNSRGGIFFPPVTAELALCIMHLVPPITTPTLPVLIVSSVLGLLKYRRNPVWLKL